jgi:CrcB protein
MRADRRELLAVCAGGAIGTLARAALVEAWAHDPGSWPWATFTVNLIGAALLGFLALHPLERHPLSPYEYGGPLLGTGLCGALTTFSGLQLELLVMLDTGHAGLALSYALASIGLGLLLVAVASRITVRRWGPG